MTATRQRLLDLVERSTITQALVTLIVVSGYVYMTVTQLTIPEGMTALLLLVVGFWFGSKVENAKTATYVKRVTQAHAQGE